MEWTKREFDPRILLQRDGVGHHVLWGAAPGVTLVRGVLGDSRRHHGTERDDGGRQELVGTHRAPPDARSLEKAATLTS